MIPNYLSALPQFLLYLVLGVFLLWLFASVYQLLTPQDELSLIRQGNVAATLLFAGALVGFLIPLARAIADHGTVMATVQWAGMAALVQWAMYVSLRLFWRGLHEDVLADKASVGGFVGLLCVLVGVVNAVAMP